MNFRSISLILFLLLPNTNLLGQDKNKYDYLFDSIDTYSEIDTTKAFSFTKEYLNIAKKLDDVINEYNAYFYDYEISYINKNFDRARVKIENLISFCEQKNLKEKLIRALFDKGKLLLEISNSNKEINIGERIQTYTYALEVAKEIDNFKHITWSRIWLVLMKVNAENYSEAIVDFEIILEEIEKKELNKDFTKEHRFHLLWELYYGNALNYLKLRNLEKADYYSDLQLALYKERGTLDIEVNEKMFLHFYNKNKGEINFLKGNFNLAEDYFKKSVAYKIPNHNITNDSIRYLAKVAYKKKEYQKAIQLLNVFEKEDYTTADVDEAFLNDVYKYAGLSYKELKNYEKANTFYEKYINSLSFFNEYKDSVYAKFKNIEIKEAKKELESIKRIEEKKSNNIYILLLFLLFGTLIAVLLFYKIKKKNTLKLKKLQTDIETLETEKKPIRTLGKTKKITLKSSEIDRIKKGLNKFEEKEQYLKVNCTLASTAKKLKTNSVYLSKIVNTHQEKNFNTYINDLRIKYVVERLKEDRLFRRYSIQSIANEIGYKSKESFNKVFKANTGILPSHFIKQLEENEK